MAAGKIRLTLGLAAALAASAPAARAQSKPTVRHHREAVVENAVSPQVEQAEAAIEKGDYAAAEPLLAQAVAANPKDYRAWYDLGFVYGATGRRPQEIDAYRRAVAAKPDVFESNLALGSALLAAGDPDAATFLRAATTLKPSAHPQESLAQAWMALGHALQKQQPDEALKAFQQAAALQPKDTAPHLAAAELLEQQSDLAGAEKEFRQAVELDPRSSEALAGLVNIYSKGKRLPGAEAALRAYLAQDPQDATAHLQLARILAAEGNQDAAAEELQTVLKLSPDDPDALREVAGINAAAKKYDQAAAQYRALLQTHPQDSQLHYALGTVLMQQRKFAEAEQELIAALRLKPDLAEAYGDLAVAASENKDYPLTLRVLDARAHYLPETPATYFLRATAYDNMRAYKQAAENYRLFLAAANGKYPDQEWQARHRLVAIDPKAREK
ncbi:MAG TPA: tetratricopeptide repeat protein [Terriglobales bacterium]|nr:tetratricopeptide repeat protein [Terriglobales bacterium]